MDTIRNKPSIKVTQKSILVEKLSCAAECRGKCKTLPRKTAFFCRGKSWALLIGSHIMRFQLTLRSMTLDDPDLL